MYLAEKLHYRAIKMNIKLYRWERALSLVKKLKTHADTLLGSFVILKNSSLP